MILNLKLKSTETHTSHLDEMDKKREEKKLTDSRSDPSTFQTGLFQKNRENELSFFL
jgi:hypothetical protein